MADRSVAGMLCNASASGNLPEVLILLHNGTDVNGFNTHNRTALQVVKLGSPALVEALLLAGADPDIRDPICGLTVTHDAAREGFIDTVRVLVNHGANTNLVDENGNLPLHLASRKGHLEVVRLLIERTANPQMPNNLGHTARSLALDNRRMEIVKYIDEYLSSHKKKRRITITA